MLESISDYIRDTNCVTGDKDHLYVHLHESISSAKKIDIIVAFLMESGVRLLVEDLYEAANNGASIRLLCGNYLNITQPQALYLIKDSLGDKIDLRFYNVPNKSFHPKAYIFEYEDYSDIYIGSSNVSRSALTTGIEWNYRINSRTSAEDCAHFKRTFEDLFLNYSIIVDDNEMRRYSKSWSRPKVFQDIEKLEDGEKNDNGISLVAEMSTSDEYIQNKEVCKIVDYIRPKGPQIEALYELKKTRLEGLEKGLIVAATGERVIIVMGAVCVIKSRVSGTLNKYISCIA